MALLTAACTSDAPTIAGRSSERPDPEAKGLDATAVTVEQIPGGPREQTDSALLDPRAASSPPAPIWVVPPRSWNTNR